MNKWIILAIGLSVGAAALYLYQQRAGIAFAAKNSGTIGAAVNLGSDLSDAWTQIEALKGAAADRYGK